MADNFGLKIGVEGESEFKKSIRDINDSFKVLKSEMNLVTSEFSKQDKSIHGLNSRNKVLIKEIDAQKDKVKTLESALENSAKSFGENDRRTKMWAAQLNNAKADLNRMNSELKGNQSDLDKSAKGFKIFGVRVRKAVDDSSKGFKFLGIEIKKAAKETDNSGGKFGKLKKIFSGLGDAAKKAGKVLAQAGKTFLKVSGVAMGALGTGAVIATKKLYDMAGAAAEVGDRVDKSSKRLGLSNKAYQEWAYVMSQNGADIESMKTGLNKLNNVVNQAQGGAKGAVAQFGKLGISMNDLKGKSREEVFDITIRKLQGVKDESKRAALASGILGKAAVGLAPLLNQTAESTDELKKKAGELGMVMSDDAVTASVNFTDSMDTLKRAMGSVKNSISAQILPGITQITDGLTGILSGEEGAAEKVREGLQNAVQSITTIIPQILNIIMSILPIVAEAAPGMIQTLVQGISENMPQVIEAISSVLSAILKAIVSALPELTNGAVQLVLALANGLLDNLPMIISAAIELVIALANGLSDALPELIPAIVDAVIFITETLIDNLDKIIESAMKIIMALVQGLRKALPKLIDMLPEIIDKIIDFMIDHLPEILEMGVRILLELGKGLIKALPKLMEHIPHIFMSIIRGFKDGFPKLVEVGGNIVESIWEGIKKMASWLGNKVKELAGGMVNSMKDALGIHSPSTVFMGIGENMSLGMGVGFKEAMSQVEKDMKKAVPTKFDTDINLNLEKTGQFVSNMTSSPFPSPALTIHIDNFVNNRSQDVQALAHELEFYTRRTQFSMG